MPAEDRLLAECIADPENCAAKLAASPQVTDNPHFPRLLPQFAASHFTQAVRGLLAAGVPVDTRGEHGGTALHWACWKGYADIVKILLDRNASLSIEDDAFHAPPAGWFAHGLANCHEGCGDYPEVARLLLNHGARLNAEDMPTGNAAVDAVLRERGLIG
jgi:ankyrin repeat protein